MLELPSRGSQVGGGALTTHHECACCLLASLAGESRQSKAICDAAGVCLEATGGKLPSPTDSENVAA